MDPLPRRRDRLRRAKSYPYVLPAHSYLLTDHGHEEVSAAAPIPDLADRWPVLAVGSNQSPDRLTHKLAGLCYTPIPVIRVQVVDFDVVYSAHFSRYGAIPATLQRSLGTMVAVFVIWLLPHQLARLHETEAIGINYDFGRLDGIAVHMDGGGQLGHVFAYLSRRGSLIDDGAPVSLASIPARGRCWPAMDQSRILARARDRLAPGRDLDRFIDETILNPALRQRRTDALAASGRPLTDMGFSPWPFEPSAAAARMMW